MSIGDLVMGAMGGGTPGQKINQALQGPQPGPDGSGGGSTQMPQTGALAGPQATQSPPDLANLYVQLMQQTRNAHDFDRNMALFAGGFKGPPGGADRLLNSVEPAQDPGTMLQNLMQMRYMQQMQNLPMPGGAGAAGGTAGAGGATGGGPAVDPRVWAAMPPQEKLKYYEDQMTSQRQIAQQGAEEKQKDLLEAQQKAPASIQQMTDMDTIANQLKGPLNPALESIVSSGQKRMAAEKLLESDPKEAPGELMKQYVYNNLLSSDELAAVNQLKKLDAQIYGDAFQSTGSRRTQQEVANLKNGISTLKNFNQSPKDYMNQFNDFQNQLHKTMNNTLGAAGRVDEIPDNLKWDMTDPKNPKPMVDSSYLPNGDRYVGGGQWASSPPKAAGGDFNYAAIPSGTTYTAPDGTQRTKQ